jgi:hypothetical protein
MSGILKVSDLPKFGGTYFHIWKGRLFLFLTTEKLNDIVDGTKIRPSTPTPPSGQQLVHTPTTRYGSKQAWDLLNTNALSIIIACLDNNQQSHVQNAILASEA